MKIVGGVTDTMVGDTSLGKVVCANLCTAVACGNESFAATGNIIDILLMLTVVDKRAEERKGTLLVLGLVACLGTLDEYLLHLASVGVLPGIAQAHSRLHLVDVLTTGS